MTDAAQRLPPFVKELIAGGIAGACGKTSVAPLERTKILIQTGRAPEARVDKVLRFIYQKDGFFGFFRGNGASVARIVPYAALHYATYERFRAVIAPAALRLQPQPQAPSGQRPRPPVWVDLLSGSCSGATAVAVTYPLDLVRTRMAWQVEKQPGASIASTMRAIAAREGLRGLYRGVVPTLVGVLPYSGVKFYTYQKLKRVWVSAHQVAMGGERPPRKPPTHLTLLFGGCAGLVGQSLTYPLDIVRRRMQVSSEGGEGLRAMWLHFKALVAQHGYRGLFRGLSVNYIKVVPSTAVGFTVYDNAKHWLHLQNHL